MDRSPISVLTAQPQTSPTPIEFNDYSTRKEEMSTAISKTVSYLAGGDTTPDWRYSNLLKQYAATQGNLHQLSWRNALLVTLQYPAATHIKSEDSWTRSGAVAQSDEHRIWISVVANTISLFSLRRDFFVPILPSHMSYLTR
jgi:hypothetical protein